MVDATRVTGWHPDAAVSVMSKGTEINSHYSVAPYYYYELATADVHSVLKSYDTLGGPGTNGVMLMTRKFRDANPKVTQAVYAALSEAEDFINKQPGEAAQIYLTTTGDKRGSSEEMIKFIFRSRQYLDDDAATDNDLCRLHAQGRHHEAAARVVEGPLHAGMPGTRRQLIQAGR